MLTLSLLLFLTSFISVHPALLDCHAGSSEYVKLFQHILGEEFSRDLTHTNLRLRGDNNVAKDNISPSSRIFYTVFKMIEVSYVEDLVDIPSWDLINVKKGKVGLNAVAYRRHGSQDIVITFRGTDSLSDDCADLKLWSGYNNHKKITLDVCHTLFTDEQLDYIQQAKSFVEETLSEYCAPFGLNCSILFNGHSLGAAISQLMSYYFPIFPSFGLSSPGIAHLITKYSLEEGDGCIFELNNPFDPIVELTKKDQIGTVCEIQGMEEVFSCKQCYSLQEDLMCDLCLKEAHTLKTYKTFLSNHPVKTICWNN